MKTDLPSMVRFFSFLSCLLIGCSDEEINSIKRPQTIETVDYREIYARLQKTGFDVFPVVYHQSSGSKQLVFIGTRHSYDAQHPMYDTIRHYFDLLGPAIAINEGGQVHDSVHFSSADAAIKAQGEIGYLKYLSDQGGIKMMNGDSPDSVEIAELLKIHDKERLLYFLVIQRFIPQFVQQHQPGKELHGQYDNFIRKYLIKKGKFPLTEKECTWAYFRSLYKKFHKKEIDLQHFDLSDSEQYFYDDGLLGQLGRSSMRIRDSVLVTVIYSALEKYDKVFVSFGGAHLMSVKPTLDKMFNVAGKEIKDRNSGQEL